MKVLGVNARWRTLDKADGIDWRYVTTAPCVFTLQMPHAQVPRGFSNDWISIDRSHIDGAEAIILTVAEAYAWDGDSVVPDVKGTLEASMIHDVLYQFSDAIAQHYRWTVFGTLGWADDIYYKVMVFCKAPAYVSVIYRLGVGAFGYIYNRGGKFLRWLTGN